MKLLPQIVAKEKAILRGPYEVTKEEILKAFASTASVTMPPLAGLSPLDYSHPGRITRLSFQPHVPRR